jgi:cytochrome bd-type quinol oxidase subunit 2
MGNGMRKRNQQTLRRTQRTIAAVRAVFAVVATGVIIGVMINGEYNDDEYAVPGVDQTVRLWQVLAVALFVLAIVFIGAIAEFSRASPRHRFET